MDRKPCIVITGAAQRVGLHCAQRFVEEGFAVIITCRRWRDDWDTAPLSGIDVILADFDTEAGTLAFIDELRRRQPKLRAFIHNASLWLGDDAEDALGRMLRVHVQAPYLINQALPELFDGEGPADIIHLTDRVAHTGSAKHLAYCASKAGMEALSRSFAARLAPRIRVNSIAPALIMFNSDDSPEYRQRTLQKSALGIEPGPEVVYQSIRFLMENPYITGACLPLDGGRHLK
jgi:dihydromonapterin reductase / dihydrofolate reductase